ncbi:SDR family NAD(P)-dependent oxidoreductase [Hymenobacter profundi]|uniref:SDR family NAD(P)-dependent oxidoreductase n=1 Tax=Hymenobacter profundi TaxID=1982110 RepID=A0ABS6WXT4_9BACT|nr:SDR family NAD(P)-dependent oxidoreductase [Hymenobacter profundi]MBW3128407.1 SDR family NAD(P)-dependent oxidoreductase [Hymenobacter profundi]
MSNSKTWFVTGASQGLGLALVQHLLQAGHRVAATSRHPDNLIQVLGNASSDAFLPLHMDLGNEASVQQAIEQTINTFGGLDVVVNNAGYGIGGSVEELTDAETRQSFDVNVFGLLNVIRHTLPHMRAARAGHIINISSIAALAGATGWSVYSATKAAVSALSEGLAQDVSPFGIRVTTVEPGGFRTNFLTPESLVFAAQPLAEYQTVRDTHARYLALNGVQAGDPAKAAVAIEQLAAEPTPPVHLLLGQDAYRRATQQLHTRLQETETWKPLTVSTDFAQ